MESRLKVITHQHGDSNWFKISYPIPVTYPEGLRMVKDAGGIKIPLPNIWSLPLRHNPESSYEECKLEDQGVGRVYYSSRQCDGVEGGIAQMLMQPEGVRFEKTFVALTLEDLQLNHQNRIGELYTKAKEFGLENCPITTVVALSLLGIETSPWDNFVFVSDPFKNQGLERLYVLTRGGRETNPSRFVLGYGHPEVQIQEIGIEWSMAIFQRTESGFKQTAGGGGSGFRWRFVFELPETHPLKAKLLEEEQVLLTA